MCPDCKTELDNIQWETAESETTVAGNKREFFWKVKFDGWAPIYVRVRTGGVDGPISDYVTIARK